MLYTWLIIFHSSSHLGAARSGRVGGVALQSAVSAPHANNVSPAVQSEDRRPLAICVRNLPIRSSGKGVNPLNSLEISQLNFISP
jgi:hypothetical protein